MEKREKEERSGRNRSTRSIEREKPLSCRLLLASFGLFLSVQRERRGACDPSEARNSPEERRGGSSGHGRRRRRDGGERPSNRTNARRHRRRRRGASSAAARRRRSSCCGGAHRGRSQLRRCAAEHRDLGGREAQKENERQRNLRSDDDHDAVIDDGTAATSFHFFAVGSTRLDRRAQRKEQTSERRHRFSRVSRPLSFFGSLPLLYVSSSEESTHVARRAERQARERRSDGGECSQTTTFTAFFSNEKEKGSIGMLALPEPLCLLFRVSLLAQRGLRDLLGALCDEKSEPSFLPILRREKARSKKKERRANVDLDDPLSTLCLL